jgi:hypothetical protein
MSMKCWKEKWICCWEANKSCTLCAEGVAEFVGFMAGEREWLWGAVGLQQVGLLWSATVATCIKGLCVMLLTELWEGGVYSGVARPFDGRDEQ